MRKALRVALSLLALSAMCVASAPLALGSGNSRALGTITGTVRDNKGNPLAGALITLLKEGAAEVVKQTRSAADGSFVTKVSPGLYSVRAEATGFNQALFSAVQVRPSDQLSYRFNLEPVGNGRTAPERRADRDSAKWRVRANQGRRSILQMDEGEDQTVQDAMDAVEAANRLPDDTVFEMPADDARGHGRIQGVVEAYTAASANPQTPTYAGVNFAFAVPATGNIDFIFAGQMGTGSPNTPQRFEATTRVRLNDVHRLSVTMGAARVNTILPVGDEGKRSLGQFSVRAVDEWVVRDGIVVVLGLDYSRFVGASKASAVSPRLGFQFDANARTRIKAAYAPGGQENMVQSAADFEDGPVLFRQPGTGAVALVDGQAVMEKSRRFEFGIERVLDNNSQVEATAFFDTTSGRGVGLMNMPLNAFQSSNGNALLNVANQEGAAKGLRIVYTRRISQMLSASAGYSFGRGQRLSAEGLRNPAELFDGGFFQTAALQVNGDLPTGTRISTVFRFSPEATVFAIDPFAGRLAVYDPSLSIMVTQELPTFGLPVRAEAVIDARNLFDTQASAEDGETVLLINAARRTVRGGISVRF
ncbi:MAG: TonB-dependent receptor [Pyrinomonadaceae bacterium]|nr:TonB-dependent receptor [Pyrinomonadaceae bacterium]